MLPSKKKVDWFQTCMRRSSLRSAAPLPLPSPWQPIDEGCNIEIMIDSSSDNASDEGRKEVSPSNNLGGRAEEEAQEAGGGRDASDSVGNLGSPGDPNEEAESQDHSPPPPNLFKHDRYDAVRPSADPDHMFFLDNVITDGTSYVFQTVVDGLPFAVRYEEEEDNAGDDESIQVEPERNIASPSRTRYQKSTRKYGMIRSNGKKHKKQPYNATFSSEVVCGPSSASGKRLLDESYQMFLKNVKECNGSLVLELENGVSVRYDKEHDEIKSSEVVCEPPSPAGKELLDESYQMFLKHVRVCDGSIILKLENGALVRYDKEHDEVKVDKAKCKDEIEEEKKRWKCGKKVIAKEEPVDLYNAADDDDVVECEFSNDYSGAMFRERLEAIIQKPFSQKDLKKLLRFANSRSVIIKYKHLRHDSVPYATNKLSRSYLDQHPDLADKLDHADDTERLCLLRGLHFWYQNLSHDGAFKPWKSGSLLERIPRS